MHSHGNEGILSIIKIIEFLANTSVRERSPFGFPPASALEQPLSFHYLHFFSDHNFQIPFQFFIRSREVTKEFILAAKWNRAISGQLVSCFVKEKKNVLRRRLRANLKKRATVGNKMRQ